METDHDSSSNYSSHFSSSRHCSPSDIKTLSELELSDSSDIEMKSDSESAKGSTKGITNVHLFKTPAGIKDGNKKSKIRYPKEKFATPHRPIFNDSEPTGRTWDQKWKDILRQAMGIVPLETKSANDKMLVYDSGIVQKLGDGQTPWTDREMNKCVKQFKELHNLKSVKPTKNDPAELYCIVECNLNRDNYSMYERLHSLPKVKIQVKSGDKVLTCIGIVDTGSNRTLAPRKIFEGHRFSVTNEKIGLKMAPGQVDKNVLNGYIPSTQLSFPESDSPDTFLMTEIMVGEIDVFLLGNNIMSRFKKFIVDWGDYVKLHKHRDEDYSITIPIEEEKPSNSIIVDSCDMHTINPRAFVSVPITCNNKEQLDTRNFNLYYVHNGLEIQSVTEHKERERNISKSYEVVLYNTTTEPIYLEGQNCIGFMDEAYFEVNNYNIEVKPWNIDIEEDKIACANLAQTKFGMRKSSSYSNLIDQDLYGTYKDKLGNTYDMVNDIEKVYENHLFIPRKKPDTYTVDDIRKNNMDPEKVKNPISQSDWKVFKKTFEQFFPGGENEKKDPEAEAVFMKNARDIGTYKHEMLDLIIVDEYKDKFVAETVRPWSAQKIKAVMPTHLDWLDMAIVERARPTQWNSNLLAIKKTDKCTAKCWDQTKKKQGLDKQTEPEYRLVLDCKPLNSLLRADTIIHTHIDSNRSQRTNHRDKVFSVYDICNAYSSVVINPEHRKYLSYTFNDRKYWFRKASQGLKGLPAFFHGKINNKMFSEETFDKLRKKYPDKIHYSTWSDFLDIYVDDLLIFSDANKNKDKQIKMHADCCFLVLKALSWSGLKIKPTKMYVYQRDVIWLGKRINGEGNFTTLPEKKLKQMLQISRPGSLSEINSILAMFQYFSSVLPFFRVVAIPWIQLLERGVWEWGYLQEKCYEELQVLLASALYIAYQDPDKDLFLLSDISHLAMSGIVLQYDIDTDKFTILSCMSRLFSPTQRRKSPSEKETLAAVDNVKFNEHMVLFNRRLTFLLADATWLSFLLRTKLMKVAMHNAAEYLSSFDRMMCYNIRGVFSIFADIVSRLYVFKLTSAGDEVLSAAQAQYIGEQYPEGLISEENYYKALYEPPRKDEYNFTPFKDQNYANLAPKVKEAIKMLANRACEAIVFSEFYACFHGQKSAEQIHQILMDERAAINKRVAEKLKIEENRVVDFKSMTPEKIQKMFDKLVSEHKYAIDSYNRKQRMKGKPILSYQNEINLLGMTRSSRKRAIDEGDKDDLEEQPWVIPTSIKHFKKSKKNNEMDEIDEILMEIEAPSPPQTPKKKRKRKSGGESDVEEIFDSDNEDNPPPKKSKLLSELEAVVDPLNPNFEILTVDDDLRKEEVTNSVENQVIVESLDLTKFKGQEQIDLVQMLRLILEFEYMPLQRQKYSQFHDLLGQYLSSPDDEAFLEICELLTSKFEDVYLHLKIAGTKFLWLRPEQPAMFGYYKTEANHRLENSYAGDHIDLRCPTYELIKPFEIKKINMQINLFLPGGFHALILGRSSLGKLGLVILSNCVDTHYTGNIFILCTNVSDKDIEIPVGHSLANLVIAKYNNLKFNKLPDNLEITSDRGQGCLGSTDTNNRYVGMSDQLDDFLTVESHFIKTLKEDNLGKDDVCSQINMTMDQVAEKSVVEAYSKIIVDSEDKNLNSTDEKIQDIDKISKVAMKKLFMLNDILHLDGEIRPIVIKRLQQTDKDLKEAFIKVKDTDKLERGKKDQFHLINGLLHRRVYISYDLSKRKDYIDVLVCPSILLRYIVDNVHKQVFVHPDVDQLTNLVSPFVYHPKLDKIVQDICDNCVICIFKNRKLGPNMTGRERSHDEAEPGEILFLDHGVSLPKTQSGKYTSVLVCVDANTQHVMAYPNVRPSSSQVIKSLRSYFGHYNPPRVVKMDRGGAFTAKETQVFLNSCGVSFDYTSPQRPKGNLAELGVGLVKRGLQKYASLPGQRYKWDKHLFKVLFDINNTRFPARDSLTTRRSLFFSPRHYGPLNVIMSESLEEDELKTLSDQMLERRRLYLEKRRGQHKDSAVTNPYRKGEFVIYTRHSPLIQDKDKDNVSALRPKTSLLHAIVGIHSPTEVELLNVLDGTVTTVTVDQLRMPSFREISLLTSQDVMSLHKFLKKINPKPKYGLQLLKSTDYESEYPSSSTSLKDEMSKANVDFSQTESYFVSTKVRSPRSILKSKFRNWDGTPVCSQFEATNSVKKSKSVFMGYRARPTPDPKVQTVRSNSTSYHVRFNRTVVCKYFYEDFPIKDEVRKGKVYREIDHLIDFEDFMTEEESLECHCSSTDCESCCGQIIAKALDKTERSLLFESYLMKTMNTGEFNISEGNEKLEFAFCDLSRKDLDCYSGLSEFAAEPSN